MLRRVGLSPKTQQNDE